MKRLLPLLLCLPVAAAPLLPSYKPKVRMNPATGSKVGKLELTTTRATIVATRFRTWSFEHPMANTDCEVKGKPCVVFLIETNSIPSTNGRKFYAWVTNAAMSIDVSAPGQAFLFVTASDCWTHAVSPVGPVKEKL